MPECQSTRTMGKVRAIVKMFTASFKCRDGAVGEADGDGDAPGTQARLGRMFSLWRCA